MSEVVRARVSGLTVCGVLAVAAITPLVSAGPAAAAATGLCARPTDTVAPQITSVTFAQHTVDLSSGPRTVGVTAHAVDTSGAGAASGIASIGMRLRHRLHNANGGMSNVALSLRSGTTADGVWQGTFQLIDKARAGTWKLRVVEVTDEAGNSQIYRGRKVAQSPTDIRLHPDWDQSVKVTGVAPPPPPAPPIKKPGKPTAFTITPTTVDTTHHAKRVTARVAIDGPTPRRVQVNIRLRNRNAGLFKYRIRLVRTTGDHWKGSRLIPRWIGSGKAVGIRLYVTYASNVSPEFVRYERSALKRLHLHPVLRTISGRDTTEPVLRALSVSPSMVDTTAAAQQVAVSASVTDTGSGVATVTVGFAAVTADEDDPRPRLGVTLHRHGSRWIGQATFPECIASGTWKIGLESFDVAGNGIGYGTKSLGMGGFPTALSVRSNPVDRTPPLSRGRSASSASHTINLDFTEAVRNVTASTLAVYALEPAASAFQSPLTIAGIICSNGTTVVDCAGSGVTSAQLAVPGLAEGQTYQIWANVNSVTPQLTDDAGNPLDWSRSAALVDAS